MLRMPKYTVCGECGTRHPVQRAPTLLEEAEDLVDDAFSRLTLLRASDPKTIRETAEALREAADKVLRHFELGEEPGLEELPEHMRERLAVGELLWWLLGPESEA